MVDLTDYWMLTDVRGPFDSKNMHTGKYYIIEMTNCETKERLITYPTQGLRNYKNWADCIGKQWGVYQGIHPHKSKKHLINGDCIPKLVEDCTQQEAKCFRETGSV